MDSFPKSVAGWTADGALAGDAAYLSGAYRAEAAPVELDGHQALVAASQRGDRRAFAALVELYQNTVYGYLRARLTEPADAEDLCQEVFLRCYLGREKLSRASAVGAWLIGIARNLLREHVRRLHRRREVGWTELCLELDQLVGHAHAESSDALVQLPVCLESLGQSAREAIDLRYRSQMRLAEIAVHLRRSEGAVKLLMHRARQALRNCLDRRLKVSR
jgi:RNA polymerase sigma-70 factor (ECF subfamily)